MRFWQMWAVARTEFRFGWRRGWPVVSTAAAGLVVSLATLYVGYQNMHSNNFPPEYRYSAEAGASALVMAWPVFQWLALTVLPMACALSIPSDRQFGVDEILRSTSLTGGIYLAGKVAGVIAVVLLTGAAMLALHLALHLIFIGPFDLWLHLELTLLNGLPLMVWAAALGVLAASGLRTRRAAVFMGILIGVFSPYPWALAFRPPSDSSSFQGTASLLSRQAASDFVFQRFDLLPPWVEQVSGQQVLLVFATAAAVLMLVAAAARAWLWRQGNI